MKKIAIYILISLIAISFFGCEEEINTNELAIGIENIVLSSEHRGFAIQLSINETYLSITLDQITTYGVAYSTNPIFNDQPVTLDNSEGYIEGSSLNFLFSNIAQENYHTTFYLRAYFKYLDENQETQVVYSNVLVDAVDMYTLALSDESDFAQEIIFIVENEVITSIDITVDTTAYTAVTLSTEYEVLLTIEEDNIILTVTPTEGYRLSSEVVLNVNEDLVNSSKYTIDDQTLIYTFKDPNFIDPDAYVDVDVTFDLDGGVWSSEIFNSFTAENSLTITALNDTSGVNYTIVDHSVTLLRWFYKLFIKYNDFYDAYEIVATDSATATISDLNISDYDYVLAIHDNCQDIDALDAMIAYIGDTTQNLFITFDSDVDPYTAGDIQVSFYSLSIISQNYQLTMNEEDNLPVPVRPEFSFIGWSDGEHVFNVFPRYQAKDNTLQITYTALWDAETMSDVELYLSELIPDQINEDLVLPSTYSDFAIAWVSSDTEIISNDGTYHRPYQATTVSLTATITSDAESYVRTYSVESSGFKSLGLGIASSYIYREYSSVTDLFFETLDIINCAFIHANSDGTLTGTAFLYNVEQYIMPKAHAQGDWVIFSISPSSEWSTIAASGTRINTFADNIVDTINTYGFDGVDIDWETPLLSEKTRFTEMMRVIYTKVKENNPNHLVTAAIAGGVWQPPDYDLINSQQYLDFINMMTYGMVSNNGYYQNALYRSTTFDNPTFVAGKTLTSCSIEESVAIYHNDYDIPYRKIIVGVAFYGIKQSRTYNAATSSWSSWVNAGSVSFNSITNSYMGNSSYEYHYDSNAGVPYIVKTDGTLFISFDNARSIAEKAEYILSNGLGGMMYWENGHDSTGTLLSAIKTGLNK